MCAPSEMNLLPSWSESKPKPFSRFQPIPPLTAEEKEAYAAYHAMAEKEEAPSTPVSPTNKCPNQDLLRQILSRLDRIDTKLTSLLGAQHAHK